ncbi:RagB/SusD family nutrient uptake outer membrane protein [Sediminitomix flava]|uniref:Putative outer membrane starch-binding protein n=1 Tax=Sediminitomix flava TaxID=379075 RepID=A0A315ZF80_SEDFL|nr:RagB/SusD family nutrient uptake outer membrane protein [Sediminitomix flava]PWJ44161.1 putative outer membrane starch-binding protein [Sediminitomix flava]
MKKYIHKIFVLLCLVSVGSACTDLDEEPFTLITEVNVYNEPSSYRTFLNKLYAGLALTGQAGPAGNGDIKQIDEGFSSYLRQYWQLQQIPTDEVVIGWGDAGLPDIVRLTWSSDNQFNRAVYDRIYFQISQINEFLRETTDEKLASRSTPDSVLQIMPQYRAEARYLRALSYFHGIDLYGDIPLLTETNSSVGLTPPEQSTREEVFTFITTDLLDLESDLSPAASADYGRASQASAWTLLSKLYLNSEVYVGQAKYDSARIFAELVIDESEFGGGSAFTLEENYAELFGADNDRRKETIFSINFDGENSQTFGGTTFLVFAAIGGNMDPFEYGVNGGWWGLRTTQNLVNTFEEVAPVEDDGTSTDSRAIFFTDGQERDITDDNQLGNFQVGYAVPKFTNVRSDGQAAGNNSFPDTDFSLFRLADVYLMYVEAVERGANQGGYAPVDLVNEIRNRAFGDGNQNITDADIDLDFIIAERSRELYWEGHRRTDLIRFGLFTSADYLWPFKGGPVEGRAADEFRDLYPIPSTELIANPNLTQNPGY